MEELHRGIQTLNKKVDALEEQVTNDDIRINTHPILFIVLMIVFFISMNFWTIAAHNTVKEFHPNKQLRYWEYILLSIVTLVVLIWVANRSGIKIRTL